MNKSDSIGALVGALTLARKQFKPIERKATNPFFKSKYADLATVIDGVDNALISNGLVIVQSVTPTESLATVESVLLHTSGEWISSTVQLKPAKDDPQGMGSAITYARRYGLSALLCIATEDDDDGNEATGLKQAKKDKPKPDDIIKPNVPESVSKAMADVKATVEKETADHFCKEHNTPFFMRGKMKSFAHPIQGGNEWCYEHKSTPDAPKQPVDVVDDTSLFPDDQPAKKQQNTAVINWSKVSKISAVMGLKGTADITKALRISPSAWPGTESEALDKVFDYAQLNGYQGCPWREIEI